MTQTKTWQPPLSGAAGAEIVARAEAALKSLAGQFASWLQDEIDKLEGARARVGAEGIGGEAGDMLYTHAHDLKGLGGTYEFPIVSRMAGSLCRLLDEPGGRAETSLALIDTHIAAIKAAVRDGIRDDANPIGQAMAASLEDQVRAAVG